MTIPHGTIMVKKSTIIESRLSCGGVERGSPEYLAAIERTRMGMGIGPYKRDKQTWSLQRRTDWVRRKGEDACHRFGNLDHVGEPLASEW